MGFVIEAHWGTTEGREKKSHWNLHKARSTATGCITASTPGSATSAYMIIARTTAVETIPATVIVTLLWSFFVNWFNHTLVAIPGSITTTSTKETSRNGPAPCTTLFYAGDRQVSSD
jgi:hypothetical protein